MRDSNICRVIKVFVLEAKLQYEKIFHSEIHSHKMGKFTVFWGDNYSLYNLVIDLNTGYVIPQFNLIFDDLFQTIFSSQAKN